MSEPTALSHLSALPMNFLSFGIPGGELDLELLEAEGFEDGFGEVDAGFDLVFDLFGGAEDVGVVLREAAHAEQAVHGAAAFVAIDVAEFGVALRAGRGSCAASSCR